MSVDCVNFVTNVIDVMRSRTSTVLGVRPPIRKLIAEYSRGKVQIPEPGDIIVQHGRRLHLYLMGRTHIWTAMEHGVQRVAPPKGRVSIYRPDKSDWK